jgi:P2-related tail formation protein
MKKIKYFLMAAHFTGCLAGCDDNKRDSVNLDAKVDIASFVINGIAGTVDADKQLIDVFLPLGTDLTALTPVIELPDGAVTTPAAGTAVDFSLSEFSAVDYHVMNGNLYNTYKVIVRDRVKITSFKIGASAGIINQDDHTISVKVSEGTDITRLIPLLQYAEGSVITPTVGEAVDFTSPVTYTLTYKERIFRYTVTVAIGASVLVIFDGEDGTNPWWSTGGANVEVPDWLDGSDGNKGAATIWRDNENDAGAGGGLTLDLDILAYNKISVDIHKRVEGEVQVELQDGDARAYLRQPYTPTGEWQTLVFDIPEGWTHLTALLVVPHHVNTTDYPIDFSVDNERHRMSWDNVKAIPK